MKRVLFILMMLIGLNANAQYIIPDSNFAAKLQQIVPNAMNGNVLDTLHPDVLQLEQLNLQSSSISDLTGSGSLQG